MANHSKWRKQQHKIQTEPNDLKPKMPKKPEGEKLPRRDQGNSHREIGHGPQWTLEYPIKYPTMCVMRKQREQQQQQKNAAEQKGI